MSEPVLIGEVDLVGTADLTELALTRAGPCVSMFLPTHRGGPQTRQDPIRLRNLLDEASAQLASSGLDPRQCDELLAPCRALLDDGDFWRYLADGLALYCARGFHRRFRVPLPLVEEVAVGGSFRIRPLLPLLAGDGHFFVLALSQNQVKLYQATRSTIAELPSGPIPASMAEALAHEDPERQLQFHSSGGQTAQFHGHGAGDEIDKATLERFFRAVDRGVAAVLGDDPQPLVLAAVAYYAPIYRAVSRHPNVMEGCVEGNPEHRGPAELHAEAWLLAEPLLAAARDQALHRLREAPTARIATTLADVLAAAERGRVDTLLVAPGPPVWGRVDPYTGAVAVTDSHANDTEDLVDRAIADTLLNAGTAFVVDPTDLKQTTAAALLRF